MLHRPPKLFNLEVNVALIDKFGLLHGDVWGMDDAVWRAIGHAVSVDFVGREADHLGDSANSFFEGDLFSGLIIHDTQYKRKRPTWSGVEFG